MTKRITATCEIPSNATRVFTAPDPEKSQAAIIPGSFLDRHFDDLVPALMGENALPAKLERGFPRTLTEDAKKLLRDGVEKVHLGPARMLAAVRNLGLAAQVPARDNSADVNGFWVKPYLRGYLRNLRKLTPVKTQGEEVSV